MRKLLVGLMVFAVACGSGGGVDLTRPPIDTTKTAPVDPYATIYTENLLTPAAGPRATTYELTILLDSTFGAARVVPRGSAGPGEHSCAAVGGFVGMKLLQVVAVTDTLASVWLTAPATRVLAAEGLTTWPGMLRLSTGVFDPLVSADTSRGHTPQRPVMWRWTIAASGTTLREDSTTACTF